MNIHHWPVCGVGADELSISVNHSDLVYYFCMEQCRDNFLARPKLYVGNGSPTQTGREITNIDFLSYNKL